MFLIRLQNANPVSLQHSFPSLLQVLPMEPQSPESRERRESKGIAEAEDASVMIATMAKCIFLFLICLGIDGEKWNHDGGLNRDMLRRNFIWHGNHTEKRSWHNKLPRHHYLNFATIGLVLNVSDSLRIVSSQNMLRGKCWARCSIA